MPNTDAPGDITNGELWRSQQGIATSLTELTRTVADMPARIKAELDALTVERITAARLEALSHHERVDADVASITARVTALETARTEHTLALAVQANDAKLIRNIVLGACAFVLLAVLGAIVAVVVITHR